MADISVIITFLVAYGAEMFQYCYFSTRITATVNFTLKISGFSNIYRLCNGVLSDCGDCFAPMTV